MDSRSSDAAESQERPKSPTFNSSDVSVTRLQSSTGEEVLLRNNRPSDDSSSIAVDPAFVVPVGPTGDPRTNLPVVLTLDGNTITGIVAPPPLGRQNAVGALTSGESHGDPESNAAAGDTSLQEENVEHQSLDGGSIGIGAGALTPGRSCLRTPVAPKRTGPPFVHTHFDEFPVARRTYSITSPPSTVSSPRGISTEHHLSIDGFLKPPSPLKGTSTKEIAQQQQRMFGKPPSTPVRRLPPPPSTPVRHVPPPPTRQHSVSSGSSAFGVGSVHHRRPSPQLPPPSPARQISTSQLPPPSSARQISTSQLPPPSPARQISTSQLPPPSPARQFSTSIGASPIYARSPIRSLGGFRNRSILSSPLGNRGRLPYACATPTATTPATPSDPPTTTTPATPSDPPTTATPATPSAAPTTDTDTETAGGSGYKPMLQTVPLHNLFAKGKVTGAAIDWRMLEELRDIYPAAITDTPDYSIVRISQKCSIIRFNAGFHSTGGVNAAHRAASAETDTFEKFKAFCFSFLDEILKVDTHQQLILADTPTYERNVEATTVAEMVSKVAEPMKTIYLSADTGLGLGHLDYKNVDIWLRAVSLRVASTHRKRLQRAKEQYLKQ